MTQALPIGPCRWRFYWW